MASCSMCAMAVVERAKGGGYALAVTLILGIYQHLQL